MSSSVLSRSSALINASSISLRADLSSPSYPANEVTVSYVPLSSATAFATSCDCIFVSESPAAEPEKSLPVLYSATSPESRLPSNMCSERISSSKDRADSSHIDASESRSTTASSALLPFLRRVDAAPKSPCASPFPASIRSSIEKQ